MRSGGTPTVVRARLESASPNAIAVRVESPDGPRLLEYRSPEPVWESEPPTSDFVAVALAQFASAHGCDLVIDGPVTTAQLERLDEYLQIWSVWRPDLFDHIRITAAEEVDEPTPARRRGAVMGFSGGVDASFALAAHSTGSLGRLTRSVDLGVLVIGWDIRQGDETGMRRAWSSARDSLDAYGARTAVVSTNWQQDFCKSWFMSFNSGLMAILHTFSGSHSSAVHATDLSYRDELKMPPYGGNMAVNHLLGAPWFPVVSTGGTHRRIERVGFLADHPVLLDDLRVCYQARAAGANCGRCEKCVRTQLELRVLGLRADRAFPSPVTAQNLWAAKATNTTVLLHFEDVLARMHEDDELRRPLSQWVRRETLAQARRQQSPLARVANLERRLATTHAELAALQASRWWRMTTPLRAANDRLRTAARAPALLNRRAWE